MSIKEQISNKPCEAHILSVHGQQLEKKNVIILFGQVTLVLGVICIFTLDSTYFRYSDAQFSRE